MDDRVLAVITDLMVRAEEHDARQPDRLARWRVLEEAAGRLLGVLVRTGGARDVVEIGTSRGVSTLWLADAVRATGGRVLSVDTDEHAQRDAADAVRRAGLDGWVEFRTADGGAHLASCGNASLDLLFLDAERPEYPSWWPHPVRVLRPGALLVADNATSHPDEIAPFAALLAGSSELTVTTVEVGKGELVAVRSPEPADRPDT